MHITQEFEGNREAGNEHHHVSFKWLETSWHCAGMFRTVSTYSENLTKLTLLKTKMEIRVLHLHGAESRIRFSI